MDNLYWFGQIAAANALSDVYAMRGIPKTAIKGALASPEIIGIVTCLMASLNRKAAEVMTSYPVHACTDITGFGLLGHLTEMV